MATVTIDATTGGTDSNSYVEVSDADTYFTARLNASAWTDAGNTSPETQSVALVMAARRLQQETWRGTSADSDQALAWPRYGVSDRDGRTIGTDTIPEGVKRAQMELALVLLGEGDTDLLAETGLEGFKRLKVGPLEMETRLRSAGTLPDNVRREIDHLLEGSGASVRMQRG